MRATRIVAAWLQKHIERPIMPIRLLSTPTLILIVCLLGPKWGLAQDPAPVAARARHFHVEFGPLPPGWTSNREVMDPHWATLKATGVNYYALGAPLTGHAYAERSNPASRLYQAWFGVYAVDGQGGLFSGNDRAAQFAWLARLAELDQYSWLEAAGDPQPFARWGSHSTPRKRTIAGAPRTTFLGKMSSHSDVSVIGPHSTELAQSLGMPDLAAGPVRVQPFHPVTLEGFYAFWYDATRDATFVVYGVSSAFTDRDGRAHNNAPALRSDFDRLIANVHIIDE